MPSSAPRLSTRRASLVLAVPYPIVSRVLPLILLGLSPSVGSRLAADESTRAAGWKETLVPFLDGYCYGCHQGPRAKAKLDLESLDADSLTTERKTWTKVIRVLREREMPPENKDQPEPEERTAVVDWLESELARFDCTGEIDPGKVTLRRLNRTEYDNTVRDLLGAHSRPATGFPADDTGYGFDNIGDVLALPPLLMEKYLDAAGAIVDEAFGRPAPVASERWEAESFTGVPSANVVGIGFLNVGREAEVAREFDAPIAGWYRISALAWGEQAGPDPVRMAFRADGEDVRIADVTAEEDSATVYDAVVRLDAGTHRLGVAYTNNYLQPNHPDPALRGDRNLLLDWIQVQLLGADPVAIRAPGLLPEIAFDDEGRHRGALRRFLGRFASRAYRRPLRGDEVDRLMDLAGLALDEGDSLEGAARFAMQAVLASPHFLYRVELDEYGRNLEELEALAAGDERRVSDPDEPEVVRQEPIDPWSLASRLSYFLWGSLPDERLESLAEDGSIARLDVLRGEVDRLLADPRSASFVESFAGQWLQVRFLRDVSPDPVLFPEFDEELRGSMAGETLRFFEAILRENRSILELLDSDFTFVDARLARHYGIEGVDPGAGFVRIALGPDDPRGGLLTQASFLTITSNPTRTSPVKRGLWVLERLLDTPPPPPPPNVPLLSEDEAAVSAASLRQRLEKHREDPVCASCHDRMDPIGFAFENFDAIGRFREFDGGFLIDPSGVLPNGREVSGPEGLEQALLEEKELFCHCVAEKILTYALGRGLEYYDSCAVDAIVSHAAENGYSLRSMIEAVVESEPFRMRRGRGARETK